MMMTLRDTNKQPRHPEAHFHLLPLELIDIIIRNLADDAGLSFPSSLLLHTTHYTIHYAQHTPHTRTQARMLIFSLQGIEKSTYSIIVVEWNWSLFHTT